MKAIFIQSLESQVQYLIRDENHHHLVHVCRIERDEEVLLLNGKGLQILTKVSSVTKKELTLDYLKEDLQERVIHLSLALGLPKKEAFELCLKQSVEIGLETLYFVRSDYSQQKIPERERINSLLESAMIQANSRFLPMIKISSFKEIDYEEFDHVILLNSRNDSTSEAQKKITSRQKVLLIVGPEGGFSEDEHQFFKNQKKLKELKLPTPILRTPTALAVGAGFIISQLMES